MHEVQFRTAKAQLSALVDGAERGEATLITRHGKPAAVVVPVADAHKLYGERHSLLDVLLAYPGGLEFETDDSALAEIDL